ncbi:MAG: restriction endonuclease subunit S [Campylobacter concisus]|nr:restriction endonuclease subunit S [Campylobacter concisus]
MSEFKNLPSGWKVVKLEKVAPLQRGYDLPTDNIKEGLYPVVYSNGILRFHNEFKAKGPGVITGRSGTIGKVVYVEEDYWPHNTSLWVTNFYDNNPKFIYYMYINLNLARFSAGSGVPTLNRNDIHAQTIPLPPLDEQEKIAEILSTWDEAINLTINLIESKKQFKKALMQNLLTAKIRFPQFKEKWKEIKLGEICEIQTGKLNANAMIQGGRYKFFTCAKEVFEIDDYAFDTEAILVSGNGENVGYIHYFNGKFNAYQRTYVLDKFTENILFIKYFLEFALKRKIEIEKKDGNTPYIVLSTIFGFIVKLPNLKEQQKIAEVLTACDDEINLLNLKLENLKKQKQGLMQKLLSGKVIVWLKNIASC